MALAIGPDPFAGLSSAIKSTQADAAGYRGFQNRFMADVENLEPERKRFGAGLSALTARLGAEGSGPTFADTLGNATRVAKARQSIASRGDAALRNQQLKDRISVLRMGNRQRGRGLSALTDAANIREGVNLANKSASDFESASNADLLGSLAGSAAAWWKNRDPAPELQPIDLNTLPGRR